MDAHCEKILNQYRQKLPKLEALRDKILSIIQNILNKNNIMVTVLEARVKTEKSLIGKLELKGSKYKSLENITDIVGARVVTYFADHIDKVTGIIENVFEIDRVNSIDKRKSLDIDSFGYLSSHYICRIPKEVCDDPDINSIWFEIQIRSILQHAWATVFHDIGYKSDIEIPKTYIRRLNRLAGIFELVDEEFDEIRRDIEDRRRKINKLITDGLYSDVSLDGDSFGKYLEVEPYENLLNKIASINSMEIEKVSCLSYLPALLKLGFKTLGELDELRRNYFEDAYQLALMQLGDKDIDFISSNIALKNLCIVYILRNSQDPKATLKSFFDELLGEAPKNERMAVKLFEQGVALGFNK